MQYLIGVDLGTTATKAVLFEKNGKIVASSSQAYPLYRDASGMAEEGKWTVEESLDLGVPAPVIALSLMMRQRSLQEDTMTGKVVAALRNGFGGHDVEQK